MRRLCRIAALQRVLESRLHKQRDCERRLDGDLPSASFGVLTIGLFAHVIEIHDRHAACRIVVAEDVERALAGVEPGAAQLVGTSVLIGLADLVLEAAALPVGVEALVSLDGLRAAGVHG